jgi:Flp pilus assembly CpaE family ATPase
MEAQDILVMIATNDAAKPYNKVSLQVFADAIVGEMLDRQAENLKLLEMIDSLGAMVSTMQGEFEKIAKELHSTAVSAKAALRGTKQAPGVN